MKISHALALITSKIYSQKRLFYLSVLNINSINKKMPKRPVASEEDSADKNGKKSKKTEEQAIAAPNINFWKNGLLQAIQDPQLFVKSDEMVNVIRDKYPKAEFHYLILPKEDISNLQSLSDQHLELLKHMEKTAADILADSKHSNRSFKVGYHAVPSMSRLHLHVISTDFNSPCIKTKKHWNSYVTDFFIESKDVRKNLKKNGKVVLPTKDECKKLMDTPLKCHQCDYVPKHMPDLKKHILIHLE